MRLKKLRIHRGEEEKEETTRREAGGGEERRKPGRDGGGMKEMRWKEIGGEEMKGKETHHPKTGTNILKEERKERGEAIEEESRSEVGTETGSGIRRERRIVMVKETETRRETEKVRGTDTGKGTERMGIERVKGKERRMEIERETEIERGPMLHHLGKIGVNVPSLLGP